MKAKIKTRRWKKPNNTPINARPNCSLQTWRAECIHSIIHNICEQEYACYSSYQEMHKIWGHKLIVFSQSKLPSVFLTFCFWSLLGSSQTLTCICHLGWLMPVRARKPQKSYEGETWFIESQDNILFMSDLTLYTGRGLATNEVKWIAKAEFLAQKKHASNFWPAPDL